MRSSSHGARSPKPQVASWDSLHPSADRSNPWGTQRALRYLALLLAVITVAAPLFANAQQRLPTTPGGIPLPPIAPEVRPPRTNEHGIPGTIFPNLPTLPNQTTPPGRIPQLGGDKTREMGIPRVEQQPGQIAAPRPGLPGTVLQGTLPGVGTGLPLSPGAIDSCTSTVTLDERQKLRDAVVTLLELTNRPGEVAKFEQGRNMNCARHDVDYLVRVLVVLYKP